MLLPPISQSPATSSAASGHVINYFRLMFWVSSLDIPTNSNDLDYDCEACFLESSNGLVSHGFSTVSCAHSSWGAPGVSSDSFKVAYIFLSWIYLQLKQQTSLGNTGILGGGSPCHYMPWSNLLNWNPTAKCQVLEFRGAETCLGGASAMDRVSALACSQQGLWFFVHAGSYICIYIYSIIYIYDYICIYTSHKNTHMCVYVHRYALLHLYLCAYKICIDIHVYVLCMCMCILMYA